MNGRDAAPISPFQVAHLAAEDRHDGTTFAGVENCLERGRQPPAGWIMLPHIMGKLAAPLRHGLRSAGDTLEERFGLAQLLDCAGAVTRACVLPPRSGQ